MFAFVYRWQLVFLGVCDEHVGRNIYHLQRSENGFEKPVITYI